SGFGLALHRCPRQPLLVDGIGVTLDFLQARVPRPRGNLMRGVTGFRHTPTCRLAQPMRATVLQSGSIAPRTKLLAKIISGIRPAALRHQECQMTAGSGVEDRL